MDFTCVLHKFIKNQSLVNNIHKSQTRSETRNVYMATNLEWNLHSTKVSFWCFNCFESHDLFTYDVQQWIIYPRSGDTDSKFLQGALIINWLLCKHGDTEKTDLNF